MTDQEALQLFKCLADRSRLQILKSLAIEDMDVGRLADRLELTAPTVSFHLKKLSEANAVTARKEQYYTIYSLRREAFEFRILDLLEQRTPETDLQQERDNAYREQTLKSFFAYGKLKSIPVRRKKLRIVLEKLAEAFEFDRLYTEKEVNLILAEYHDDFCTLRRALVDEGLLARDQTGYWRVRQ